MKTKIIKQSTREQRVKAFIANHKYLADPKYYKTNKVSTAAFDSWAARGQAGGCRLCLCKSYRFTFHNTRYSTQSGRAGKEWYWQEFGNLCSSCYEEIERQCNFKFKTY